MKNSIFVIKPYKWEGLWVFDDPAVGLVKEPFVGGADTIIDVATAHLPNAAQGFLAVFSAGYFPDAQIMLEWVRKKAAATSTAGLKRGWRAGSARRCSGTSPSRRRNCTSRSSRLGKRLEASGSGEQVMKDRRRGALIGLAVGDALGAAVEFSSPGSFTPVTGYRSGGPHGLKAGEWTDDTSMALALADSMASAGWDLNDQASRYVEWWQTGKYSVNGRCFDIGVTTRSALSRFVANKTALASGDASERASGNGSIMRLAPVPIGHADLYPDKLDELARLADESSLPTHASEQCRSACRYLATVLAALVRGEDRAAVLSPTWKPLQILNDIKPLHPLIREVAQGSFRHKQPPAIEGSGWVVKSLEASLWAFHDAGTFEEAVLRAVNLGDDADTTGAICGQLAGAFWGESKIPSALRSGLARMDMLESALAGILAGSRNAE